MRDRDILVRGGTAVAGDPAPGVQPSADVLIRDGLAPGETRYPEVAAWRP